MREGGEDVNKQEAIYKQNENALCPRRDHSWFITKSVDHLEEDQTSEGDNHSQ